MNFLAHFHLAWPDPGLIAGGLEGDYYKGPLQPHLPADLACGIQLHRDIDAYTDAHPVTVLLRQQFPRSLRRYAGILIDLSYDHYLTLHWQQFSDIALNDFNAQVYRDLSARQGDLSGGSRQMVKRLQQYDILGLYGDWAAVGASAERVGERFRRGNPLLGAGRELEPLREELEASFLAFYPDLQQFASQRLEQLLSSRQGTPE